MPSHFIVYFCLKIPYFVQKSHFLSKEAKNIHKNKPTAPEGSWLTSFIFLILYIRHERQMSCSLNSSGERPLMSCTVSGDPSRKDLASLGYISLQLCRILIIDHIVFSTKNTYFFSSANAASPLHRRIGFVCFIISHLNASYLK